MKICYYSHRSCHGPLFMGNGEVSAALAFNLLSRIHNALNEISAAEQGGLSKDEHINLKENLEELAKDITHALTGKVIKKWE